MKLIRFLHPDDGQPRIGVELSEGLLDYTRAYQAYQLMVEGRTACPVACTGRLLREGGFVLETFRAVCDFAAGHSLLGRWLIEGEPKLLPPVCRPGKIVALGFNYHSHASEMEKAIPSEPIIFCKASSALVGPGDPVIYHQGLTRVDPEVELGVVIGRTARRVAESEALSFVAGYTVVNDVTARDLQSADIGSKNPWFRSKSLDTFCPVGPRLVLPDEIPDPGRLELKMRVNGQVRQQDNTSRLIFGVPKLISYISSLMTLEPGDLIATGTPEGIAPVHPGDLMEAWVEGIGGLVNPVAAEGAE